jgi:hypothetical protein
MRCINSCIRLKTRRAKTSSVDHNDRQCLGPAGKAGGLIGFDTIGLEYQHPELLNLVTPSMKGNALLPPARLQLIGNFEYVADVPRHILYILTQGGTQLENRRLLPSSSNISSAKSRR